MIGAFPKAGLIDIIAGSNHVFQGHSGGKQTLVRISKSYFGNSNFSWTHSFDTIAKSSVTLGVFQFMSTRKQKYFR